MKIKPLESIIKYFKNIRAENRAELDRRDKLFELHKKKAAYIDSLQLNIGSILGDRKKVIYDCDNNHGYYVAVGTLKRNGKKSILYPDLTIILETHDVNNFMLRMWNAYRDNVIREFLIQNDDDYKTARNSICDYVTQNIKKS